MGCEAEYYGRLKTGMPVKVTVSNEKITDVEVIPDTSGLPYILPVLVDLQHNGALGVRYSAISASDTLAELLKIADHLRCHGVGRCLLTVTTCKLEELKKSVSSINKTLSENKNLEKLFFGIFHEGIFISPLPGWRGAHPECFILDPDYKIFSDINDLSGNRIKIVNIAPERKNALQFIEKAVSDGKMVAIGHCFPDTHAVQEAVKCGASIVTHFANGVAPQIHRFKNPFWAMLENSKLKFGLICDGFHLPPELVKVALKFKGFSNCFPVSDASHWSGCPDGLYCREGYPNVVIEKNGYMHIENEDLLAGAWFQQNRCVEFLVEKVGMDFLDAWNQCSLIPAEIVGIRLPEIKKGEEASFVLANWDKGLVIEQSVHCGKPYLKQHLTTNMSSIL